MSDEVRTTSDERLARLLGDLRILEKLPDFISVIDRELRIAFVNRVRGGHAREDVTGKSVFEFVAPAFRERFREAIEAVFRDGGELDLEIESSTGATIRSNFQPVLDEGTVAFVLSVSKDVSEARTAELALRDSETRLRHAIEASGMGTWTWVVGADHVVWDATLREIFGIAGESERIHYATYLGFIAHEDRALVANTITNAVATGIYREIEHGIVRRDGTTRRLVCKGVANRDANGVVVGLRGGVFDVSERFRLEQQVQQAQKMEAIGRLTAGIAHNFNNLLGIILPSVELSRRHAAPPVSARLDDIEHAALRAADMVRELMLFARGSGLLERRRVDLVSIAARTVSICRATFGPTIAVEFVAAPGIPAVAANSSQIEQVLLNVLLNARDAIEEARPERPMIAVRILATSPGSVTIRVEDNGSGMDEVTRASIFEPFFTTKEGSRGTGLGLSSAYAIVVEHKGRIECESRPGFGTAIVIELPLASPGLAVDPPQRTMRETRGDERILVIDDEVGMRRVIRAILEGGGYTVEEAERGEEGIEKVESSTEPFDLVIADRSMPGLCGDALLDELDRRVAVPVVVLSGDPSGSSQARASAVLSKPVSSTVLLETVRDVLDRSRAR